MDHENAVATKATERYLMDEMPSEERDAFEEHYFDCHECAFDVRSGARMIASLREAGAAAAETGGAVVDIRRSPKWSRWMPKAAAAAVIFGTMGWFGGAQYAVRGMGAATSQPQIIEIEQVDLSEAERGPGDAKAIAAGSYASLNVDIPPADDASSYAYAVVDAAGKTWFSGTKSREQAVEPVSLLLPALPRGSYRVVIEGVQKDGNRFPIDSVNFRVGDE